MISPDGAVVACVNEYDKDATLRFLNVATRKAIAIDIPRSQSVVEDGVLDFYTWIGARRIIYQPFHNGYAAIDYDGTHQVGLSGAARSRGEFAAAESFLATGLIHARETPGASEALFLQTEVPYDYNAGLDWGRDFTTFPNVVSVDTRTGAFTRQVENPGNVVSWFADRDNFVRIGVQNERGLNRVISRDGPNAGWAPLRELDYNGRRTMVLGLSGDAATLYLARLTSDSRWGVYAYDVPGQKLGDLVLSHARYDIVAPVTGVAQDGFAMQSLVFSRVGHELLGVRFVTDHAKSFWLDPTLRAAQSAIDEALPKRINTVTSFSDDLKRVVVLSWTARDPGTYYLFDREKASLAPLFARAPWIKPEQMGEVYVIGYKARDGLPIEGYLTVPNGREPKHLPLLVMPHGGPWVRDALRFDPMAQFLANRGYAVLQVNYRGSVGYGDAFLKKGMKQIGRGIQDDIADGTRWAIDQGIADPTRIAILGGSYGGYSTLMGLAQTPELYRCGVDIAGVTDWVALVKNQRDKLPIWYHFVQRAIGDPEKDAAELMAVSPVTLADKIRVPLLIIHGKDDPTVPYEQAVALMAALDRAHRPYELMARQNEAHGFRGFNDLVAMFARIEQFLAANLPAEPAPPAAPAAKQG